jgi:lipoprotein Spr
MHRLLSRPILLVGAVLTLAGAARPTAAQSAPTASSLSWSSLRPTASATPSADVSETAGPRRRPTRRSAARSAFSPAQGRPDTVIVVSSRASASATSGAMSAERVAMVSATLRDAGRSWLGTPYRWGGQSRRGIDCSAFVRQFMLDNLGVDLPRATAGQQYEGVSVRKEDLLPGDLVFFRRHSVRHVGVYLGGGEFIHASSSRGVTVSDLSEGYYEGAYWMARRVVSAPSGRRPTPRRAATDSSGVRG